MKAEKEEIKDLLNGKLGDILLDALSEGNLKHRRN